MPADNGYKKPKPWEWEEEWTWEDLKNQAGMEASMHALAFGEYERRWEEAHPPLDQALREGVGRAKNAGGGRKKTPLPGCALPHRKANGRFIPNAGSG